jgi:asparagine synthase (glutamine-hydrolysing)
VLPIHNLLGFREYQKRTFWNTGRTYDTNAKVASLMSEITHGTSPYDLYVRKISNIEYKLRLPELILARLDYPSMAASVEIRSPFMDHALIEQQSRISWDLRMKDRVPKYLLKEIAARHLPREAAYGPKVGFTHVFVPFLQHHLPRLFRTEVVAKDAPLKAYVKSGYLEWASRTLRDENLWRLYALNKWLELHA